MNPDCERHQREILAGTATGDHHMGCNDCGSFFAAERWLAPPDDLVARTVGRLRPTLHARAANRRAIFWQLALAGAFSLPIIVALNATLVWMTYAGLARLATPEIATLGATLVGGSLLLALSLAYGSLPLLASWGVHLRERTT